MDWNEWKRNQIERGQALPLRIRTMHRMFGENPNQRCGDCKFLLEVRYRNVYFKCTKSRMSSGQATDWRKKWAACGQFEAGQAPVAHIQS